MVAPADGDGTLQDRRLTGGAAPPHPRPPPPRCRKQKLTSRLSDSGFEEDLSPSPGGPPAVRVDGDAGHLSAWYLQYGDIGYRIQKDKEAHFHPCRSLARQPQVTAEARCTLVSWLLSLHKHLGLSFECCCLAVNVVDRFLASTPVAADCFQLVGAAALLLASKQVEVCSPRISLLLSFCCDAFTKEQLCNLECLILLRLNFRLDAPTLAFFLDYYAHCVDAGRMRLGERSIAQKACELSLADYSFNRYPPSVIAGSSLWLAGDLVGGPGPQQAPEQTSGYSESPGRGLPVFPEAEQRSLALECKDKLKLLLSLNREEALESHFYHVTPCF